ncbi:MAG: hypothetical protein AUK52_03990 [Comamonadaceae bacterium CG2_30_60_41]|nr:MAG: hypothetical protein AUK52_03990 [Comamonadaceae bacterium CG2_30_60_41]
MPNEQQATRHHDSVNSFKNLALSSIIKINHDISAKNNIKIIIKRPGIGYKINNHKFHVPPNFRFNSDHSRVLPLTTEKELA